MPPCLTLGTIRYGSRVKWRNPGKGVASFLHPGVVAIEKGDFGSPTTMVANFTFKYYPSHNNMSEKFANRSKKNDTRGVCVGGGNKIKPKTISYLRKTWFCHLMEERRDIKIKWQREFFFFFFFFFFYAIRAMHNIYSS